MILGGTPPAPAGAFPARLEEVAWLVLSVLTAAGLLLAAFGRPGLLKWTVVGFLLLAGGGAFLLALVKYIFTGGG